MYYNGIDKRIDVVCNRITYRHSLMGYRDHIQGFQFGWLAAKVGDTTGKEFAEWCEQHDRQLETQEKIEWLKAHLSAKDRAIFNELVTELHKCEQQYKEKLEQELTLSYEDHEDIITIPIINKSVTKHHMYLGILVLVTLTAMVLTSV